MIPKFRIVIPARYAASRLPGKLLKKIQGKTLLEHVYLSAKGSRADQILIATDDDRIYKTAVNFGAQAMMTATSHHSGTERIAEVAIKENWFAEDIVINLQGDEMALPSQLVDELAMVLASDKSRQIATLCEPVFDKKGINDLNVVKVVFDNMQRALYFSRSLIPSGPGPHYKHIGLYAYRARFLQNLHDLPMSPLASSESLEQLRFLQAGYLIYIAIASRSAGIGIDTAEDLERARSEFS